MKKDSRARIGVYVCHCGGNISEVVDVEEVVGFAGKQPGVILSKNHTHMCSDIGQQLIIDDIEEHDLDKVVVAACSPQFQGETFMRVLETAGLSPYVVQMANIREQCAWPHFDTPELATKKAKELVNAAIAKVRFSEPLEKKTMPIGKRVLVIGGGIAGIQASLDLGDAGFEIYLVEKEPSIGGHMAQLSRTFPTEDCSACILSPKMADVQSNPNINLLTYSEVENVEGYLGNFKVKVTKKPRYVDMDKCVACGDCEEVCPVDIPDEFEEGLTTHTAIYTPFGFAVPHRNLIDPEACINLQRDINSCGNCIEVCKEDAINFNDKPEEIEFTVDTIIVATGYDIFNPSEKKVYGYDKFKNVITALEMERMIVKAAEGNPIRDPGKRIGFIQCVGSRDEQVGREYCSRVCCMYATKLASLLKHSKPERDIYVFYTDLRAFGKGFEEYYKRAQNMGVKFIRGRVAEVMEDSGSNKVILKAEDTLTRQIIEAEFDTVVLSVGMGLSKSTDKIAEMLRLAKSEDGFLKEAHPKFKPVDTNREGIFLAGTVQGPKDIPDTVAQASAAASRAVRLMNQREYPIEPIVAFVHEEQCDGCELCIDSCPLNAISISAEVAEVNEALCRGCGSCVASCPRDALDLHMYTNKQLLEEIKNALEGKEEGETRILVVADDTCTYRLADSVGTAKLSYTTDSIIIRVPSGSRITPKLMLAAFKLGADGIFIGECEDRTSPFPHSGQVIRENITKVREILKEEGIKPERLRFVQFVTIMLKGFVDNVNGLVNYAREAGAISPEKREKLVENVNKRLFGEEYD
ncbi:FAD-dependent oxidoreductase [candidate division WOR-3 bacterium]|nr:FAD-dependent oxidoreductase [candidate division WOR-3 bacterium]